MNKAAAKALIDIYGEAWETRDPNRILDIFTEDATYNDPSLPENQGHAGIRAYWTDHVAAWQRDIKFNCKNIWVDGDTVIAEWEAHFIDTKRNLSIKLDEVAIFTVRGDKFCGLREYYKSEKTALV